MEDLEALVNIKPREVRVLTLYPDIKLIYRIDEKSFYSMRLMFNSDSVKFFTSTETIDFSKIKYSVNPEKDFFNGITEQESLFLTPGRFRKISTKYLIQYFISNFKEILKEKKETNEESPTEKEI